VIPSSSALLISAQRWCDQLPTQALNHGKSPSFGEIENGFLF